MLSKGLNVFPSRSNIDNMELKDDLNDFARTLKNTLVTRRTMRIMRKTKTRLTRRKTSESRASKRRVHGFPNLANLLHWNVIYKTNSDVVHLASNKYSSFYNTSYDEKKHTIAEKSR